MQHKMTLEKLVDWSENAIMRGKYQDNETKTAGHWDIQKIKEPRGNWCTYSLPCEFDVETRIFKTKDLI